MVPDTAKAWIKALIFILLTLGPLLGAVFYEIYRPPSYKKHSEIYLSRNSQIKKIATSGDGSSESPYIIDSLNINTTERYALMLYDINDLSIIIQNCTIRTYRTGLYIESCSADITIRNCTILSDIRVSSSSNISICDNSGYTFILYSSQNVTISENFFKYWGTKIQSSEQITVTRNVFNRSRIMCYKANNCTFTYNSFEYSSLEQLIFDDCYNNTIFSNNFTYSGALAIEVIEGENNIFYHNNFISSWMSLGPEGVNLSHVEDNGVNNFFYSTALLEGNFWDNYNGTVLLSIRNSWEL